MSSAISTYLPMAFGVALSPMAIIAMIVLCVIGRAKSSGVAYLIGAIAGMAAFMILSAILAGEAGQDASGKPSMLSIILQFSFALFLLFLAIQNWRNRPKKGEEISEPKWIAKLKLMSNGKVFGIGAFLMVINAKNLPVMASAALIIVRANSSFAASFLDLIIFILVGSLGMLVPWLMAIFGGEKTKVTLESMRDWLYQYNNVIMTLLFGFLGISTLGNALALLS